MYVCMYVSIYLFKLEINNFIQKDAKVKLKTFIIVMKDFYLKYMVF